MIPVLVNPSVRAHVAVGPHPISSDHPAFLRLCPVCDERLSHGPIALVYVGRDPDLERGWTAAAVAVHAACTDDNPAEVAG